MVDDEIVILLRKEMGLQKSSISRTTLDHAVQKRMQALAVVDRTAYVEKLKSSASELHELIEEVVIPETWFFRGQETFAALNQFLIDHWAPRHKNTILKILSAPCSTGEEPYSIAMSLLDAGWPAAQLSVHGVDISRRSIARAKQGIYANNSFRGSDLAYRTRYFTKNLKSYALDEKIRDQVSFHIGNVLHAEFMEELGVFDVIFFRNILIYFDPLSRQQAIDILDRILARDGLLFVGHAEVNLFRDSAYTPFPYQRSFALLKKNQPQPEAATGKKFGAKPAPVRRRITRDKRLISLQTIPPQDEPDLRLARKLADRGELQKAAAICETYLERNGPSFQAFFLLGIISEATDEVDRAEKMYRKALYLDPHHEEVLVFLMLLAEKKGDGTEAKTLQQRLKRVQSKNRSLQQNDAPNVRKI